MEHCIPEAGGATGRSLDRELWLVIFREPELDTV